MVSSPLSGSVGYGAQENEFARRFRQYEWLISHRMNENVLYERPSYNTQTEGRGRGDGVTEMGSVARTFDYYFDEFAFRFNQRGVRSRGLLFYRLLEQAAQTGHTTTDELHGTWGVG